MAAPQKCQIELPHDPAIPHLPKRIESKNLNRYYPATLVHSSIIHSGPKGKSKPSVHGQMDKENVAYVYTGKLLSLGKEGNSDMQ